MEEEKDPRPADESRDENDTWPRFLWPIVVGLALWVTVGASLGFILDKLGSATGASSGTLAGGVIATAFWTLYFKRSN